MTITVITASECELAADYELHRHDRHIVALSHCKESDHWDGYMVLADARGDFTGRARRLSAELTAKLADIATTLED